MEITLDLFGFTKNVDVSYDLVERGKIDIPLSYHCDEFKGVLWVGAEIKAIDMEHSYVRFYQCSDGRWRPKREP